MIALRKKVVVAAAGLAIVLGGAGGAVAFAGSDATEPTPPVGCSPSIPLERGTPGLETEPAKQIGDAPDQPVECSTSVPVEPGTPFVPAKPLPVELGPGTPAVPADPAGE
ncbi:hypothetical protein OOZ19_02540 [Saccharopolyspora sp. NFXS83]|uniref:hypothetical protein n=1 Tax=Saccharopolyspora sp. NFXS83 TaxID=2993560 RepID=UPI00224B2A74|nr:hypothetical protein [Saccharopolyspora sp. NFXS83]MCX2729108.1 hypothetical protein [Saccharopolyspora sp. NFXS83]